MFTPPLHKLLKTPVKITIVRLAGVAATGALLIGCSGGNAAVDIDVSEQGRLAYACALTSHVHQEHGDPASWSNFIGDDANPGVRETAAAANLLRASEVAGVAEGALRDLGKDLMEGISRVDVQTLSTRLDQAATGCEDIDTDHVEVSHEDQQDYACALTDQLNEEYGPAAQWTDANDTPAPFLSFGIAGFSGALNGQTLENEPALSEAGKDLANGVTRQNVEVTQQALTDVQQWCEQR